MLQLYVTVFFYKVSFLKKEIDTDQDVEVGPDRQTDRPIPIYLPPPQTMFAGDIIKTKCHL
jgi:hypothetical protein